MSLSKKEMSALRNTFKEQAGHELILSDEIVNAIYSRVENVDDMDDEEIVKLLTNAEQEVAKVAVTDPGISVLVSKIDDTFSAEIAECVGAAMKNKTTAVDVYAQMKRVYTKDEMDAMPVPGTDKDHVTGNQKPDKVSTKDQTGKPITKYWWNDFVSATPLGKQYENDIDDVKKEQKTAHSVPRFRGVGKADLASMLATATAQRNALRSMFKRAGSLHHQWEAIGSMPKVKISWIKGSEKKADGSKACTIMPDKFGQAKGKPVSGSPKPIWIRPEDDEGGGRDFSVTQVLAFDVPLALKNGGTMADLIDTAKTGADTPEGDTGPTLEQFIDTVPAFAELLNKRENMATLVKKINTKEEGEWSPSANDLLESLCSLHLFLKPIYDKNKKRFEELLQEEEEEEKAA